MPSRPRDLMIGDMKIKELMTEDVVAIAPETPIKQVAAILSTNHISGAPVCDRNGVVLGVISEADILRKEEGVSAEVGGSFSWLLRRLDGETAKVSARTAAEAMTSPAVTIRATASTAVAARLMIERRINRLPVVSNGDLVGIITRADLVRAFHRPDTAIADEIREDVIAHALWLPGEALDLTVRDGVVTISGLVETEADAEVAERLIRRIPGVLDVHADLRARVHTRTERRSILEFFPR
jgi:CBS domain-containing protein